MELYIYISPGNFGIKDLLNSATISFQKVRITQFQKKTGVISSPLELFLREYQVVKVIHLTCLL